MNPSPIAQRAGCSATEAGPDGAVPARSLASWSALWRYSTAQIVVYGSLATMLMPLVAQAVAYASALLNSTDPKTFEILLEKASWRVFAVDLYISGWLLVIGKLLTQLACPERIRRFPYEDDHFVFIGDIKAAKQQLDSTGSPVEPSTPASAFAKRLAKLAEIEESSSGRTNSAWRESDLANPVLRWFVAVLFALGSAGIVAFLGWRAVKNFAAVLGLGGL